MMMAVHDPQLTQPSIVKAELLIRKPAADVFEAFIDPAITSRFWFTKGSGKLDPGKQVQWDWEMFDVSAQVVVKEVETNKRILIEWGNPGAMTVVEWLFTPQAGNTTFVTITNSGVHGDGDEIVEQAIDAMGGFTLVLAGAKAFLEHNIT